MKHHPNIRVLILLNSLAFGGAQVATISIINHLNSDKFSLDVAYLRDNTALCNRIDSTSLHKMVCLKKAYKFDPLVLLRLKQLCDERKYDAVMSVCEYPLLYVHIAKQLFGFHYKTIINIQNALPRPGLWTAMKNVLYKRIINMCDRIVFVSKNQMEYWIEHYHIRRDLSECIYNSVDITHYQSSLISSVQQKRICNQYNIKNTDIVLGTVADLRPEKKIEHIIAAVKMLCDEGYPVKLLIVGDGPMSSQLLDTIREKEMKKNVFITGYTEDVRAFLAVMDCLVNSSVNTEALSLAALEAMAMAKPLIMSDIGGASELVQPGVNGFLYPSGDVRALVAHIKTLIQSQAGPVMGQESRRIVVEHFTMDQMAAEYERIFFEVKGQRNYS